MEINFTQDDMKLCFISNFWFYLWRKAAMGIKNQHGDILHRIKVKLYPNYLKKVKGAYFARTDNEASLTIDQVCVAMKNRGGFTGSYEDLVSNVRQFLEEAAYQICDGFAVNMKYFSVTPNIGGTFNSAGDEYSHVKNPVSFRFRTRKPLRDLAKHIAVDILGLAGNGAYIYDFYDSDEKSTNTLFVPGDAFRISGSKIKIEGDDPGCGLFFVPVEAPAEAVKVKRIVQNSPSTIIGIAPDTEYLHNRIEVRTQYAGSTKNFLKEPRVIASSFVLESA
jgi:hypothetical protein